MKILNLTQHAATPDQVAVGVVEPADKKAVQDLLTFAALPRGVDVADRAAKLAAIAAAHFYDIEGAAMIGGAGYLMGPLEAALREHGIKALHAFSVRESVEKAQPDGSVKKELVFRHAGFVPGN